MNEANIKRVALVSGAAKLRHLQEKKQRGLLKNRPSERVPFEDYPKEDYRFLKHMILDNNFESY